MSAIDPEVRKAYRKMPKRLVTGPILMKLSRRFDKMLMPKTSMDGLVSEDIPTPGTTKTIRIHRRSDSTGAVPVVFWIHGGGYIAGNNTTEDRWGALFCRSFDCAVVAAGYRLAPENPFPAGLDDLRAAVQWILDHGADQGLDPGRILIAGESGGGGLAAALTQRLHDEGVLVAGQLLACPMLDDRTAVRTDIGRREHILWTNGSNHFGWSSYLGTEPGGETVPEYAVPARRSDLAGLPPTWIGVGDLDLFWDENLEYGRRLEEAGVPVTLETAEGGPHGYQTMAPEAAISKRFNASAAAFAKEMLGG